MSTGLILSLAGLALVDSTSIGTLFVPAWLLLTPGRVRVRRVLVYLATITAFYYAVGLALVLGAGAIADELHAALNSRAALWVQLVFGVGLFVLSFRIGSKRNKPAGRTSRWRQRAMADTSRGWMAGLALLAGLAEIPTMLPYLAAIAMLTTSTPSTTAAALLLVAYCLIMVLPACLLLAGRVAWRARIEPLLHRLDHWITAKGAGAAGWIVGIAGFLIARDAIARLWFAHMG